MMNDLEQLKQDIKQLIVDSLGLEDLSVGEIDDDVLLFGESGLGLDSIDALELGVALRKKYRIQLEANSTENRQHFQTVNTLAALVRQQQIAQ